MTRKIDEVQELLDVADQRLRERPKVLRVFFEFKGKSYVARQTNFRLLVDTSDGKPVACRWF